MFIYNLDLVNKLVRVAKSREYVQNNSELCKLLENPYLKDDTELAIRYNEYKSGKPDSGKEFVDYFFTHGPELDTGTLIEWRKIITNDPTLYNYGISRDVTEYWTTKVNDTSGKSYSWINDLYDCLSKPCQYLGLISPIIGTLSDVTAKYNGKNTNGSDTTTSLLGIPSYFVNKMPKYVAQGIMQLTDMISNQSKAVYQTIKGSKSIAKEDPYVIKQTELIGGDLLADIASRLGDCFRIYEYKKRYNPYDPEQNIAKAGEISVFYDAAGNPHTATPNGSNADRSVSGMHDTFSDNVRLNSKASDNDLVRSTKVEMNTSSPIHAATVPFIMTIYNAALTSDKKLYSDATPKDKRWPDPNAEPGNTCGSTYHIMPNSAASCNYIAKNGKTNGQYYQNFKITCGGATRAECVVRYFRTLFANMGSSKIPSNLMSLTSKAIRSGGLVARLFYPRKNVDLLVYDVGGGGEETKNKIWLDVCAQYYLTSEGQQVATLYSGSGPITSSPMPDELSNTELEGAVDAGTVKYAQILGNGNSSSIPGLFYFTKDFCQTNGLDESIFNTPYNCQFLDNDSLNNLRTQLSSPTS